MDEWDILAFEDRTGSLLDNFVMVGKKLNEVFSTPFSLTWEGSLECGVIVFYAKDDATQRFSVDPLTAQKVCSTFVKAGLHVDGRPTIVRAGFRAVGELNSIQMKNEQGNKIPRKRLMFTIDQEDIAQFIICCERYVSPQCLAGITPRMA